jgi:hypothetical protein
MVVSLSTGSGPAVILRVPLRLTRKDKAKIDSQVIVPVFSLTARFLSRVGLARDPRRRHDRVPSSGFHYGIPRKTTTLLRSRKNTVDSGAAKVRGRGTRTRGQEPSTGFLSGSRAEAGVDLAGRPSEGAVSRAHSDGRGPLSGQCTARSAGATSIRHVGQPWNELSPLWVRRRRDRGFLPRDPTRPRRVLVHPLEE